MQDAPLHKKVFRAIRTSVSRAKRATKFGLSRLLYGAIGGSTIGFSTTGVDVTIPKSLQVSSYFRAINLLSDAVGKTAFAVKMGADEVPDHPAHALVKHWARHHQLSADIFRRTLMKHALLYGNGYARIVRQLGEPIRLVVLNPSYVTPVLKNGVLRSQITDPDREDEGRRRRYTVSASDIIHIKGFTINGWVGIDPIQYWASEVLGIAISTQSYAASYYATGGQPTAYIHSNESMSDEAWNNFERRVAPTLNSDLQNPHAMPVLEGMDIKSTGLTAEQTQLIEARKHSMLEVVNMMGVPPHKVGLTQSSAYKSLEEENKAFREDALEPWLTQFEMEFRKLLTEEQQARETHRIEANRFDLSRTDVKSRFEALSKATGGAAFMTPNDARKLNGQENHPDGDTLHKPPTNEKKDGESDDSDSSDSSRSASQQVESTLHQVRALTHIYSRVTKRLATEAIKRSKKSEDWPDYLERLTERHAEAIRSAFEPIIPLCGGRAEQAQEITESLITEFRTQMAAIYDTATRSEFPAAVSRSADEFQRGAFELAHSTLISLNA